VSLLGVIAILGALVTCYWAVIRHRRGTWRRKERVQFVVSVVGWGVLWFATASSFATDGMTYLPDHMIGHVLVMFLVPVALISGGVSRQWWWVVPVNERRRVLRWWYRTRRWHAPKWLKHPLVGALALNGVMVASHTPAVFNYFMSTDQKMELLMEPAFLLSGLWFFHFLVVSYPRRLTTRLRYQFALVVTTMFEMFIMAMAMSIFTKTAWYTMAGMAGMTSSNSSASMLAVMSGFDFHNQQLAAGILWICGDFWAVPLLVLIIRRVMSRDGSLLAALERYAPVVSVSSVAP